MSVYAHKLVAHVATEMANAVYEECAKDNLWYALNKDRAAFVNEVAPTLVQHARSTLTDMLQTNIPDEQKQEIMDALVQDRTIPRGPNVTVN